jgi:uncharacterized protein DUF4190
MALCIDCGTALLRSAKDCPACGAPRQWVDASARQAGTVPIDSWPAMDSEMTIAEVRLVTTGVRSDAGVDRREDSGAAHCPNGPSRPTRRSWVAENDLALCALVLGVVSVVVGLLGHGWFGIVAVGCGRKARRSMGHDGARRVGSVFAITGLVLGWAAIVMTLGSLAANPPWR